MQAGSKPLRVRGCGRAACLLRLRQEPNSYKQNLHYARKDLPLRITFNMLLMNLQKIRYINCCIVEFGKKFGLAPRWAFQYLHTYKALEFLDKHYEAEHLLPLQDTISSLTKYCKRHGGTIG